MKDLHSIVVPKVAINWYELGIQLVNESRPRRLDQIKIVHSNDPQMGCIEMLKYWLDVTPGATWDDIISTLRKPGLGLLGIADDIEKEIKG